MKEKVLLMKLQGSYVNLTMKLQESYVVFSYKSMSGVKNTKVGIVNKRKKIPDPDTALISQHNALPSIHHRTPWNTNQYHAIS